MAKKRQFAHHLLTIHLSQEYTEKNPRNWKMRGLTPKNGVHIETGPDTESSADSSNFSTGFSGKIRKPRSKVSKACDNCRKRKIKCNGKFPCASCEIYSCECTFSTRQGGARIKTFIRRVWKVQPYKSKRKQIPVRLLFLILSDVQTGHAQWNNQRNFLRISS